MQTITTFAEVQKALRPFYDTSRTMYTLDTMRSLMKYLGDPQEKLKVIHVAGTSGKTSTAYYAAALLAASGKTVGLSVSPHVDQVNERLQVNGAPLPEEEFCLVLTEFLALVRDSDVNPSYFELLVGLAYWDFARRGLDYAVIEVGLGGLLDGTNVVTRPDKVCLITDIGLDHTEILGDTVEKIAAQKAGIIHAGNTVFMCAQDQAILTVIQAVATNQNADLHILPRSSAISLEYLPSFQQRNLGLATVAVNFILERDGNTPISDEAIVEASHIVIPARLERFEINGKTIIVDGSHNQQKLHALLEAVRGFYPGQAIATVTSFVAGNDGRWQGGLQELQDASDHIIFTTFQSEQDIPKASITVDSFTQYCISHDFSAYSIEPDPAQAYAKLLQRPEPVLLITGSFYLLNHIRPLIKEML